MLTPAGEEATRRYLESQLREIRTDVERLKRRVPLAGARFGWRVPMGVELIHGGGSTSSRGTDIPCPSVIRITSLEMDTVFMYVCSLGGALKNTSFVRGFFSSVGDFDADITINSTAAIATIGNWGLGAPGSEGLTARFSYATDTDGNCVVTCSIEIGGVATFGPFTFSFSPDFSPESPESFDVTIPGYASSGASCSDPTDSSVTIRFTVEVP